MQLGTALAILGLSAGLIGPASAAYKLVDDITSSNFWNEFAFFSDQESTSGTVQYVDHVAANKQSLAGTLPNIRNAVYMGVDHVSQSRNGRASVCVTSNKTYNHGLFAVDIQHVSALLNPLSQSC